MEFEDDAFVLAARAHGEAGAIVDLLTANHGRYAAHVAGGASRKMKPFLQAGAQVILRYRARVSDQLGSAQLEPVGEGPSALFDDPLALCPSANRIRAPTWRSRRWSAPSRSRTSGRPSSSASRPACSRTWVSAWIFRSAPRPAPRTT